MADEQLTPNFWRSEFDSKDGKEMPPEILREVRKTAQYLQTLRDHIEVTQGVERPITVNSGYRSKAHNKAVGGSKNSQHLYGKAADIVVDGLTPAKVKQIVEELIMRGKMKEGGIGLYPSFLHYDHRGIKARW